MGSSTALVPLGAAALSHLQARQLHTMHLLCCCYCHMPNAVGNSIPTCTWLAKAVAPASKAHCAEDTGLGVTGLQCLDVVLQQPC